MIKGLNMSEESRRAKRFYGLKNATILDGNERYPVILTSISKNGISVMSEKSFPTFREITIEMELEGTKIEIKGSIRWVVEQPQKPKSPLKEIGVSIFNPPVSYLDYIGRIEE